MKKWLKKNSGKASAPAGQESSPYLNARLVWDTREASMLSSRNQGAAVALLSLLITLAVIGGYIYERQQSKYIPYIVEVDQLGKSVAVKAAERASPLDPLVASAVVASFIHDARLVTPDAALQRKAIFSVYSMLQPGTTAMTKMNEYLNGQQGTPFERARTITVHTEDFTVLAQTPTTWQVTWKETTRERQGGAPVGKPVTLTALVTIYQELPTPKTTEKDLQLNPQGIHVSDFSWTKQL